MDFTPNAKTQGCCKKVYWKQWIIQDSYWQPWHKPIEKLDYTAGKSAADFPGDNVNAMGRDRNWGREYILRLFCDEKEVYFITWSYKGDYKSGSNASATVTLEGTF